MKLSIFLGATTLLTEFFLITSAKVTPLIYGGTPAEEGQFPYMVSIQFARKGHVCGGVIVASRWIVTAGHCIKPDLNSLFKVVLGTTNLNHGITYKIVKAFKYPSHDRNGHGGRLHDIGMIKVEREIEFNDVVKPIEIEGEKIGGDVNAVVSGWGRINFNETSDHLLYTNLTTISNKICHKEWSKVRPEVKIRFHHLCTTSPVGVGPCHGDSGSALEADGKLIGIVSFAIPCARGVPDVFERVSYYKRWIEHIVKDR